MAFNVIITSDGEDIIGTVDGDFIVDLSGTVLLSAQVMVMTLFMQETVMM